MNTTDLYLMNKTWEMLRDNSFPIRLQLNETTIDILRNYYFFELNTKRFGFLFVDYYSDSRSEAFDFSVMDFDDEKDLTLPSTDTGMIACMDLLECVRIPLSSSPIGKGWSSTLWYTYQEAYERLQRSLKLDPYYYNIKDYFKIFSIYNYSNKIHSIYEKHPDIYTEFTDLEQYHYKITKQPYQGVNIQYGVFIDKEIAHKLDVLPRWITIPAFKTQDDFFTNYSDLSLNSTEIDLQAIKKIQKIRKSKDECCLKILAQEDYYVHPSYLVLLKILKVPEEMFDTRSEEI